MDIIQSHFQLKIFENEQGNCDRVWNKLPPMHQAVADKNFGLWCFLNLIGGEAGALNGQSESSIALINFQSIKNSFTRMWISSAKERYGKNALSHALALNDRQMITMLLENGYNIDDKTDGYQTLMHKAVKEGYSECIKTLLKYNADVNVRDSKAMTPLHWAVKCNQQEIVKLLMDNNANVNVVDEIGFTPLHYAAQYGDYEALGFLKESEAELEAKENTGKTALHIAVLYSKDVCVKVLLDMRCEVNATDHNLVTPLHIASTHDDQACLKTLLNFDGNVHAVDNRGLTPLHKAVMSKSVNNFLLLSTASDADISARDQNERNVLHHAAIVGSVHLINAVLKKSPSSAEQKDIFGRTPLFYANSIEALLALANIDASDNRVETNLECAAMAGPTEVIRMVEESSILIDYKDKFGRTLLFYTVMQENETGARVILDMGVNVNIKDDTGKTCLHYAADTGNVDLCKMLLRKRADVNSQDKRQRAAIHYAVEAGNESFVKVLLDHKADVNIADEEGKTALHIASKFGWKSCLDLLLLEDKAELKTGDRCQKTPLDLATMNGHTDCVDALMREVCAIEDNQPLTTFDDVAMRRKERQYSSNRRRSCRMSGFRTFATKWKFRFSKFPPPSIPEGDEDE